MLFAFKTELLIDDSGILQIYDMGSHMLNCFYKLLYCFMVAKVQLFFEIKREEFPKVEGKIPIPDLGYLFHFSGMAVIIKRDCYLLLKPNMTE